MFIIIFMDMDTQILKSLNLHARFIGIKYDKIFNKIDNF